MCGPFQNSTLMIKMGLDMKSALLYRSILHNFFCLSLHFSWKSRMYVSLYSCYCVWKWEWEKSCSKAGKEQGEILVIFEYFLFWWWDKSIITVYVGNFGTLLYGYVLVRYRTMTLNHIPNGAIVLYGTVRYGTVPHRYGRKYFLLMYTICPLQYNSTSHSTYTYSGTPNV